MIMKGDHIYYKKGYKYQLQKTYKVFTGIFPEYDQATEFIILRTNGYLTIKQWYAWDGPSGPTFDTPSSMRGSLVHDALYQMIRLGLLDPKYKTSADDLLHDICVEDGMIHLRAELWEEAVENFGGISCQPGHEPEVLTAP
jgi:hypothetical protein